MSELRPPIPEVDQQVVRDLVRRGERVVIVDVRSREEFSAGHITGAINIPIDALTARANELPWDAQIVTACNTGGSRSHRAVDDLTRQGYQKVMALKGGTRAWLEAETQAATHKK